MLKQITFYICVLGLFISTANASERIPLKIEKHVEGAPITLGIPFAIGTLNSPDDVRSVSYTHLDVYKRQVYTLGFNIKNQP